MQLAESPAFLKMKAEGTHSKAPLTEAFGQWKNAKWALLALLGLVAGQAVVWYTGQFYALFFLTAVLKVDAFTANLLIAWSLAARHRRLRAVRLAVGQDRPQADHPRRLPDRGGDLFPGVQVAGRRPPTRRCSKAHETVKVVVAADPADCSFQFNPTGTAKFTNGCDVAKGALARASVIYSQQDLPAGSPAVVKIGDKTIPAVDTKKAGAQAGAQLAAFNKAIADTLTAAGYPAASNPSVVKMAHPWDIFRPQPFTVVLILIFLVVLVTMVYGPIAAALVELFPTRIRYTSMSLPYHIGNGWFGGLLPATVFAMNAQTGSIFYGLWYPIVIAGATVVIGLIFLPETKDRDIFTHGDATEPRPGDPIVEFEPMAPDV